MYPFLKKIILNRYDAENENRKEMIRAWYDDIDRYMEITEIYPSQRHYGDVASGRKLYYKLKAENKDEPKTAVRAPSTFNAPTVSNTNTNKQEKVPQNAGNQGSLF